MRRFITKFILAAVLVAFHQGTATAQNVFYGSAGIEVSNLNNGGGVVGPFEASNLNIGKLKLSMGRQIGQSGYMQVDLRHSVTSNFKNADDTYNSGTLGVFRAGTDMGNGTLGGFLGGTLTSQDDDNTDTSYRTFFGIEGAHSLSTALELTGQLGRIEGTGGTDATGLESIRKATFARVNFSYGLSEKSSVSVDIAGAFGVMDTGSDDVSIAALTLGYQRHFSDPNKMFYAQVSRTVYNQYAETDVLGETQVSVGVNIRFGNSAKQPKATKLAIAPVEKWIAQTGGVME